MLLSNHRLSRKSLLYHQRREIIGPLIVGGIAVVVVGTVGQYVIRALKRLNEDSGNSQSPEEPNPPSENKSSKDYSFPIRSIGLDLGPSFARVSFRDASACDIVENHEGSRSTPSVIQLNPDEISIGTFAARNKWINPSRVLYAYHALVGLPLSDPNATKFLSSLNLDIDPKSGKIEVNTPTEAISAERLRTYIAKDLFSTVLNKVDASGTLPTVISVPNFFSEKQILAALESTKQGGFRCVAAVPDAVCAVVGAQHRGDVNVIETGGLCAVVDVGGRLSQVSVVKCLLDGTPPIIVAQRTIFSIGGEFISDVLVKAMSLDFLEKHKVNLLSDNLAKQRLYQAAEDAKLDLSNKLSSAIYLPYITANASGPIHFSWTLSRSQFDNLVSPHLSGLSSHVQAVLHEAGVSNSHQLNAYILTGGSARMPLLQRLSKDFIGLSPVVLQQPEEATCLGAGAYLSRFPATHSPK
jgi:molecular chaperone DnaK